MLGRRVDRIEEQLRIEISEIIEREIQDPRVGLATVTGVKISSDLRHARIYITALGEEAEHKKTIQGLTSAANYIRRSLSKRLHHLKRIPELIFDYDESVEQGLRIAKLLEEIKPDTE
jgi:ribosome-binding factor A